MGKREYGTGTIEKRGDKWRARVRDPKTGRRIAVGSYDTEDAAKAAIKAQYKVFAEEHRVVRGETLRDIGEKYLLWREVNRGLRWNHKERSRWNAHIARHEISDALFLDIDLSDLRAWFNDVVETNAISPIKKSGTVIYRDLGRRKSTSSLINIRKLMIAIFEYAIDELELQKENLARRIKIPIDKRPSQKDPVDYLTKHEIQMLIDSDAIPFENKTIFQTAIYTGLRKGELWGLHWDDILFDQDNPEIIVRHSYTNSPKGRAAIFDRVPLLDRAKEVLLAWRDWPGRVRSKLVFPTRAGNMRCEDDTAGWDDKKEANRYTFGYRHKAGITRHIIFHQLRKTCGTHLVSGTWGRMWDLKEVQHFLRHKSFATTERHYARFLPDSLHAAAKATRNLPELPSKLTPKLTPRTPRLMLVK